jgi:hypothetical protein
MRTHTSVQAGSIEDRILLVRGQRVILDSDLADIYGVQTKVLNQAVKRNRLRFPDDFVFRLSREELERVNLWKTTASARTGKRSQIVTASTRNIRFLPRRVHSSTKPAKRCNTAGKLVDVHRK